MFGNRKPRLTRQQQLAAKPVQLVHGELVEMNDGGCRLTVPLTQKRWAGWLFRVPAGATKSFDLDALGRMVWESCDGKTSVQQIARRLAKTYRVSDREAQVSTETFLATLARKGLIGAAVGGKSAE